MLWPMKNKFFLLTFCLFTLSVFSQNRTYVKDDKLTPREHNVDMQHLLLDVSFEPKIGKVIGNVALTFTPLLSRVDSLYLDAPNIIIHHILMDEKEIKFSQNKKGITLFFTKSLSWENSYTVTIDYHCFPRKGIYFIGWNDEQNLSRKQIWTQGQGIDNRHWIPHYDEMNDKLITELIVHFDKDYKVLSNGNLIDKTEEGDLTKWHYKITSPHPSYLIMLGIGEYDILEKTAESGTPLNLYYYPDWESRVSSAYRLSKEMFDYLEREIDVPYPWESYAQIPVQDFMYGAMENTTATLFGDFYFVDSVSFNDINYVYVNAHELAHQWFGDCITSRTSSHHWLQESFATYYGYMVEKEFFGKNYFDNTRRKAKDKSLKEALKNDNPVACSFAGGVRKYPKGAMVLDMLKYVVGEDEYRKAIKHYLEKHAYENVDSEDLLIAFHESLGLSLDWFWEQWVYKGGEPNYEVSYKRIKQEVTFIVEQLHDTTELIGLFKMPIVFEIHFTDGTSISKKVMIANKQEEVKMKIPKDKKVAFVLFDADNKILKNVTFKKSYNMLKAQVIAAENILDRYDALVALKDFSYQKKKGLLFEIFNAEEFYLLKTEVISQLEKKDVELLIANFMDKHKSQNDVKVKNDLLNKLEVSEQTIDFFIKALEDLSYRNKTLAYKKLVAYNPDILNQDMERNINGENDYGRKLSITKLGLFIDYGASKDSVMAVDQLIDYTSNSYEFLTRVNAINMLKSKNLYDESLVINLLDAIYSPNKRLRGPAKKYLKELYKNKEVKSWIDKERGKELFDWQITLLNNLK
ncbi:MAG TPA: M1 family peptidase [Flavobacteriales bacterium]|nr:M1 family peptidase [Flavobacteriales bacterium]